MKKLPKVNTSKLLKAALPYILVGLMATKLGQAYRMASGGDVLDRILGAFLKIGEAFANPLPSLHPFDLPFTEIHQRGTLFRDTSFSVQCKRSDCWCGDRFSDCTIGIPVPGEKGF